MSASAPASKLILLRRVLRRALPTLVLSAGLAAAFLAHAVLRDRALDLAADEIRQEARRVVSALQDKAQTADFLLAALGALYAASVSVEEDELDRFLNNLHRNAQEAAVDYVGLITHEEWQAGGQRAFALHVFINTADDAQLRMQGNPLWHQAIQRSIESSRPATIQSGTETIMARQAQTSHGIVYIIARIDLRRIISALIGPAADRMIFRLSQNSGANSVQLLQAEFGAGQPVNSLEFPLLGWHWQLETQLRDTILLSSDMTMARLALGSGMIVSLILFYAVLRQRESRTDADRARLQLVDAIESLNDAFALFDAKDRLVIWNRQYAEALSAIADRLKPGLDFEALLRLGYERGVFPPTENQEAVIAQRVALHRQGGGSMEQELSDHRWMRIAEARTSDGGIAGTRVDITGSKHREKMLTSQVALLERVAQGGPLEDVLYQVMQWAEDSIHNAQASLLRLDSSGTKLASYLSGRLPEAYMKQLLGLSIGQDVGSCGTAAYTRKPIYCSDISTDPRWAAFRDMALSFNLHACWSVPIIGANSHVYGTFAVYFDTPREPDKTEKSILEIAGNLARLALERDQHMNRLTALARHDAVDRLSGGIAHDFNNLLQAMEQATDLLLNRDPTPQQRPLLNLIREATGKGAALIRRLLVFARGQEQNRETISPDESIRALEPLLRQAVGEAVVLDFHLSLPGKTIQCDRVLLESALLNLAINARDAMPDGGRLVFTSRRLDLSKGIPALELAPGTYACISASDTGSGMDQETARNAFVPYFSTKEVGRGSGLGLSMVYGFARSNGGGAGIETAPGQGTRVTIYLPLD
ncbi:PAS-domain containing protein [Ferrovibrio sp.]|uniref:PAS-domain containing protein n=1 Tax=Ferrovibrio sp. TaxID=1917215 RepID=UPI0025B8BCDD|nr:PAS-domain containing protein [Ferrovibrio sp.]MBX3454294.1 PAS-domain containing protein [Ferrovibrio sp.]